MLEEWRPIKGFGGIYEVSNLGNIRSFKEQIPKLMKVQYIPSRYASISLYYNKKQHTRAVHRLVAEAFIPNPDQLPWVNHKDEDKHNNHVANLEWCTPAYNTNYGEALNKRKKPCIARDSEGNIVHRFESTREASYHGFNLGHVSNCCLGRIPSHKGLYWSYE